MAIVAGTLLAGRYRADALLGRGGMGEVWRCHDLEQGEDVAIKAIRLEFLSDPGAARLFQGEVVAVARLCHPGIVPVYDLLRDPGGQTLLVMEYRRGRSLGSFRASELTWPFVHEVLVRVVEALAYAHARGVLHLDIKPENVLVEGPAGSVRITLLDFGVARVRRPGRGIERWFDRDAVIGTIEYMPPEQCSGSFERLGPWSDLFSVGAMAFELCAGRRPFPGGTDHAGLLRRLQEPPPRLVPAVPGIPRELADLVDALLALEPRDRPLCAADVLAALRAMAPAGPPPPAADPTERPSLLPPPPTGSPDAITLSITSLSAPTTHVDAGPPSAPAPTRPLSPTRARALPEASVPDVAERAFTAEAEPPPAGAYGLFGLRDLPVLGRYDERRAVWSAVRTMLLEQRPQVVLLEGPAGVGKSRIARDALERAVEAGLAIPMQTSWSAEGSGDEGLRGLLENLLDTRGQPAARVRSRLDFWLDRIPEGRRPFAREVELLLRPPPGAAPDAGLPLRVAVEAVARAASLRPVLLWLDDVQWSRGEADALIGALKRRAPPLPVGVIATVRSEELEDRPSYEQLAAAEATSRVLVRRLDADATRRLARGLLDVDDALCDLLTERAEGNPLFVTQLLRQLVLAEAVERRGGRYGLARGADLSAIPADIGAIWKRRVAQSGAGRRELAALALVRERVSLEVAEELARAVGPSLEASIERALASGLVRLEGGAYVWEHGLLRDYLVRTVEPAIAPGLHAIAAAALAPLVDREDVQEERAHHLHKAGRAREACAAMLEAALWSLRRAEAGPRRARLEALVSWATKAHLTDLAARGMAELAYAHAEIGEGKRAADLLTGARAILTRGGADEAASWVAIRQSQAARLAGKVDEGARFSEEALARARGAGVGEVERLALLQIGVDRCRSRDLAEGRRILGEAEALCRAAGDAAGESIALRTLAHVVDTAEGLPLAEKAIERARSAGALRVELVAKQVWVDLLWRAGERDAARREARALAEEAGRRALRQTVSLLELQSAAWAAAEKDWADARAHRDAAAEWGAAKGAIVERVGLLAIDVNLALAAGNEPAAEATLAVLAATLGGYQDENLREMLRAAAAMASPALASRIAQIVPPRPDVAS